MPNANSKKNIQKDQVCKKEFASCDVSQNLQTNDPVQLVGNKISQIEEKRNVSGKNV